MRSVFFVSSLLFLSVDTATAVEIVEARRGDEELSLIGELMVEAADGGILLQTGDLTLWTLQPAEIVSRGSNHALFVPWDQVDVRERLSETLPREFEFHETPHYLIAYNTTLTYAKWCGTLYERLYRSFENYWKKHRIPLSEPPALMVALVFGDQKSYQAYAASELGPESSIVGYYSLRTNRIATYDLTGVDSARLLGERPGNAALVKAILSQPNASSSVATLIHEATHQLAYNRGLQTRYADNPVWLSEGLAMYFETPDIRNSKGWRRIGTINQNRLSQFKKYLAIRPSDSLRTLISDDARMSDGNSAVAAYAESWALCYFLIRKYPDAFDEFLQELAAKIPLLYDTPRQRLELFQEYFGADLVKLDDQFVRYMSRQR